MHGGGKLVFLKELLCGHCGVMKLLAKCFRTTIEHFLEKLDVVHRLLKTEQVQRLFMFVLRGALGWTRGLSNASSIFILFKCKLHVLFYL
jgi:hypothetical protein